MIWRSNKSLMLLDWDFVLDKESVEAGIYVAFERQLLDNIELLKAPEIAKSYVNVGMKTAIDMLGAGRRFRQ